MTHRARSVMLAPNVPGYGGVSLLPAAGATPEMDMPSTDSAQGMASSVPIVLSSADRAVLASRIRAARTEQRDLLRAQIVCEAARGSAALDRLPVDPDRTVRRHPERAAVGQPGRRRSALAGGAASTRAAAGPAIGGGQGTLATRRLGVSSAPHACREQVTPKGDATMFPPPARGYIAWLERLACEISVHCVERAAVRVSLGRLRERD